jgi:hypothetical protein
VFTITENSVPTEDCPIEVRIRFGGESDGNIDIHIEHAALSFFLNTYQTINEIVLTENSK